MFVSNQMICASELFTVALVGVILLTVTVVLLVLILVALVGLLEASRRFRPPFFRKYDDMRNRDCGEEQTEQIEIAPPENKKRKSKKRSIDDITDGIPTVPLNMPVASEEAEAKPRRKKKQQEVDLSDVATVEIQPTATYVTRSETIAKTRKKRKSS